MFTDCSAHLGNLFVTLKHVPYGALQDDEFYANEEQNCSDLG
jgi:hypothetical protein